MTGQAPDTILGDAPAIVALRDQIRRLAAFDRPGAAHLPTVLLLGETGTGKGLVARLLHASGARARGPLVDVNCAAIPETMLEAELFGFEAGAFTDARRAKPGLFEAAAGGTLFLDEVDALPLVLQGKLLTAIEEKSVRRLGAVAPYRIDAKLVAATQRDLRELVAARAFRADLFHRLAVVVLELPPLRARGGDVVTLAEHFLARHAAAHGLPPRRLDDGARAWLLGYAWPGNVRELSHLMERVTLLTTAPNVGRDVLEQLRVPLGPPPPPDAAPADAPPAADDDEPARIRDALRRAGGNVVRAARLLGIGRNALRHRMARHGITRPTLEELARGAPAPRAARAPAAAPPRPAEPSWEHKLVAVLAIDLVLPPGAHEPWTAVRRWQRIVEDRVRGFGGVFVSRTPARLTAVFGIPRALEQLPERAVQAALAIHRLAAEDPPERRPELRQAIHVGAVRVDVHAADPATTLVPIGDTLGLAERLLGHAGAGELLVSPAAARRVEATCELRPRTVAMGATERLEAAVVAGRRAGPAAAPEAAESRFVGRARELELLRGAFDAAAAGDGQVALVVGEPGMGKSRLVAELRAALADGPHRWIEGRCASYATMTAFHPIADAMRRLLGIDERDDAARAADKLARGTAALGPEQTWMLPFLQQVLGLRVGDDALAALDSASRRSEIFRALKALLLGAGGGPLVLVVEDLHWIDPESQDFLAFLADAVPATPTLLLCSYRTGHQHPFGERSYVARVLLRPLSPPEMAAVTGSLLGTEELPDALRGLIAAKAEGNPFFVEEVTRSLLEEGAIRRENGRVVLTRALDQIAVPDTIQDVLIARLDRLADEARRAIQVASVIGREFALRLLERIADAGTAVRAHVEELRAVELIYEKAAHPELAFMFKHALTHDVAYASVVAERRRELHRTIGLAIEELYADRLAELYETLAHHFERAEEWERALDYRERAIARAADAFANLAVIAHCRHALATADRLGDAVPPARRQRLEEQLGAALFYASEFRASADAWERAAALAADPAARAHALSQAAMSALWAHDYPRVDAACDEAAALARRHGPGGADPLYLLGRHWKAAICHGDMDAWRARLEEALAVATRLGDEAAIASTRLLQAMHAEWTGDYPRAIAASEAAVAAGRRLRLPHLVVWPQWFLGKACCCLGDYGRAVARMTEAAEVCRRIGDRAWQSRLLNTLGWCHQEIGAVERARELNERAAALAHAVGDPEIVANAEINLATNWLALGDVDRARRYLEPIEAALAAPGDPWMRWRYALHLHHVAGRAALVERRPEAALAAAEAELAGARRFQAAKVTARAQLLRGEALLAMDRRPEAEAALREAARLADAIAYPRAAWQALAALGEAARRDGRADEAARLGARRQAVLDAALASLADADLRRALARSTAPPA
jgi:DNA-binding NtrC family response regulator